MELPHLLIALQQYGLKETPGAADNEIIIRMAAECGFKDYKHDDIAWCSLFMNWVCMKANKPRSNGLNARSWVSVGSPVTIPVLGDLIVLSRPPETWTGHIGIFISEDETNYYLLAGNQNDMVNITPFKKDRLVAARRV